MSLKYIIMAVFIFVILHLALIPLGNEAMNAEAAEHLNNISHFGIATEETDVGAIEYAKAPANYFSSLFYVITSGSDSPLFTDDFYIIGWLVLSPILAGYAFGIIMVFWSIFVRNL